MDDRPDTSSARSQDGWSFLNHASAGPHDAQQPPSSYLRSDQDSLSPLPNGNNVYTGSRSSLSRNIPSASTGARSITTVPQEPVLLRIHSETAYNHNHRPPRRPIKRDKNMPELPALEEFTMQAILSAMLPDVEGDVGTISEVLGRSRFTLADQYEAQLPPQGEIIMHDRSQDLTGFPTHPDHAMGDNVIILNEDASLHEGSQSGSAVYRAIEGLQVVPRPARINSDGPALNRPVEPLSPVRTHSSPAAMDPDQEPSSDSTRVHTAPRDMPSRPPQRGPARPVVSETYLSADADGSFSGSVPIVSEAGRHFPLYAHDDTGLFEPSLAADRQASQQRRLQGWSVPNLPSFYSWFTRSNPNVEHDAETRLRILLSR